jgi:hypothetical protein
MLKENISIVHFQPLEVYPPVMNVINSMVLQSFNAQVISTPCSYGSCFTNNNIELLRINRRFGNLLGRYFWYLQFAIQGFWNILKFRPNVILYYESYSVFPVFLYSFLFTDTRIFIHYHEYESLVERNAASGYSKFLFFLERSLIQKAVWVSQTNADRKLLFLAVHRNLNVNKFRIFPNFPSRNWIINGVSQQKKRDKELLRILYVGSLGMDTTYISEFLKWVEEQKGKVIFTIISQKIKPNVQALISNCNRIWVNQIENMSYQDLPSEICKHDIGVVLYSGHIPNFVYNVPNKVNEYLACGLNVWYSDVLISTRKFAQENPQYPLYSVDFSKGKELMGPEFSSEPFEFKHWHEDAVQPLIDSIKQAMNDSLNTF